MEEMGISFMALLFVLLFASGVALYKANQTTNPFQLLGMFMLAVSLSLLLLHFGILEPSQLSNPAALYDGFVGRVTAQR